MVFVGWEASICEDNQIKIIIRTFNESHISPNQVLIIYLYDTYKAIVQYPFKT